MFNRIIENYVVPAVRNYGDFLMAWWLCLKESHLCTFDKMRLNHTESRHVTAI